MADPHGKARETDTQAFDALADKIAVARKKLEGPESKPDTKYKTLTLAWQMILELVVGAVIGGVIGYALDWAFGTLPLFLILFMGFGVAAGVKAMLITARNFAEKDAAPRAATEG